MKATKQSHIFLDGQYISIDPALLDIFIPGRIRLQGVFETIRCADGKVEFLEEHLNRLLAGLKALKIRHRHTIAGLKHIAATVLRKNPLKLGRLRLMVFQLGPNTHCLAMTAEYRPPSANQYRRGLKVKLVKTNRPATASRANVKSLDYGIFATAYEKAKSAGCDEALLINRKGHIFEASRANIFIILDGKLITPPLSSGCLNGVIRQQVIAMARNLNIPLAQKSLTPAMLKRSGKIFLTNSMAGIILAELTAA